MSTKTPIANYSGVLKEMQSGDTLPAALIPSLSYQPLDATLTALAGANWAANSLAVGSGSDTVAQVTFAANSFPARSSSGNLVAKTITDFGLSLIDDTNAAAARTTLGLGSLAVDSSIVVGSTALSSGTNGRVLYQSGGVVQQSGSLIFNGTDLDLSGGGNLILSAGYLFQKANGRNRFYNLANSNWAEMWNPSTSGAAELAIYDGTGTGIRLDGSGNVGINSNTPSAKFHVISTGEQFRAGYDTSNYASLAVSSSGVATFDAVGSSASFVFSDKVIAPVPTRSVANTNTTVTTSDEVIIYSSLTAGRTVTLPAASTMTGRRVIIKDGSGAAAANNITINVSNPFLETIDAGTSVAITTNYGRTVLVSDGTGWWVIG
jgi:hypothetical protein